MHERPPDDQTFRTQFAVRIRKSAPAICLNSSKFIVPCGLQEPPKLDSRSCSALSVGDMEKVKLCPDCDHVLYPREDEVERRLLYACTRCSYKVPVEKNIFFLRKYRSAATGEVTPQKKNPVLPCSKGVQCVKCKHREATFFQSAVRDEEGKQAHVVLFLVCSSILCGHRWRADHK